MPSKELQDLLNKLGTLNQRHEDLKAIVDQLKVLKHNFCNYKPKT